MDGNARGLGLIPLPIVADPGNGNLGFAQYDDHVPFVSVRAFYMFGLPEGARRGRHAHRLTEQFMICLRGAVRTTAERTGKCQEFTRSGPGQALYLPPMTWLNLDATEADSVVLVLASHPYNERDYVHDYAEFRRLDRH